MSEHDFPKTTVKQVVLSVVGGLFAPALVIFLIVKMVMGIQATHLEDADPGKQAAAIAERIKPVAEVEVAEASAGPHVDKSGEEVVGAVCSACHGSGALGSPKIGDKAAWGPRIAQGYETLIKHAIAGIRQMPARGGNPDLTDGEIANAIAYMANQSGAHFTPPAASAEAKPEAAAAPAAVPAKPAEKPAVAPAAKVEAAPAVVAQAEEAKSAAEKTAAAPAHAGKSGEEVFKAVCTVCHSVGAMGAPKFGDKADWAPRIKQGYDTLVQHAIKGIRMMPAKGGNPSLSDDEVAGAVAYMANQSGASFPAH